MSEPFLGQISIYAFDFAPRGFAFCDGQILPINQNQALYALLGTTYGGDGRTSFALPDLRGRVPLHVGQTPSTDQLGDRGGEERHTLSAAELPPHTHSAGCRSDSGTAQTPVGNIPAVESNMAIAVYGSGADAALNAGAVANTGDGQSHENMQPFLTLSFAIALQGIFPSRN